MTRRVAFCAAVFCVAALLPVSAVSASESPEVSATSNDRKLVWPDFVLAPAQTTGPSGLLLNQSRLPWGLDRIDQRSKSLNSEYTYSQTGAGVKVYVVDTGVQADHSEFIVNGQSRVLPGWSYRNYEDILDFAYRYQYDDCPDDYSLYGHDYERQIQYSVFFDNRLDPNDFLVDETATIGSEITSVLLSDDDGRIDNYFHGTHVASIIAGQQAGVAKDASIVPVRVSDSCGRGNAYLLYKGLEWILEQHQPGDKSIVNLSLGFFQRVSFIDNLITTMINKGIVVVAAAGNIPSNQINNPINRDSCLISPAGSDSRVITVGAADVNDAETAFSFGGNCVDVFAPGDDVLAAWSFKKPLLSGVIEENAYLELPGTSMAAPHVAGALARYLQNAPVASGATVSENAMTWLKTQATCNAVTYARAGVVQTPNRLLTVDAPVGAPCPVTVQAISSGDKQISVSWSNPIAFNGVMPTYTAVVSPGGQQCVTTSTSCTISGLVNNQTYAVTVTGANSAGSLTLTGSATPNGAPLIPTVLRTTAANGRVTFRWTEIADSVGVTYQLSSRDGRHSCVTTGTSCTIRNLPNGKPRTLYLRTSTTAGGTSLSETGVKVWAGFNVRRTEVKRSSRTLLTSLVTPVSKGRRSWSASSPCRISSGRLVAPRRATSCFVTLKVGKTRTMPATSIRLKVAVR